MSIVQNFNDWRNYRRTVRELGSRSNRELHDMGIARWRVRDVARGYGFDRNEVR